MRLLIVIVLALFDALLLAFCAGLQVASIVSLSRPVSERFNVGYGWLIGDLIGLVFFAGAILVLVYTSHEQP